MPKPLGAVLALGALSLSTQVALGDPGTTRVCIEAHRQAQIDRGQGRLKAARTGLDQCVDDECPAPVKKECAAWLEELDAAIPTVVFSVTAVGNHDVIGAKLSVDGEELPDGLNGKPVALDPGEHRFRVEARDGRTLEKTLVVRQGERDRAIAFELPPERTPPPHSKRRPRRVQAKPREEKSPTLGWVLVGVGGLGMASFGYFGATGYSREKDLSDDCAPRCPQDDIDGVRRNYVVADISLGVGVVALAVGTWLLVTHGPSEKPR